MCIRENNLFHNDISPHFKFLLSNERLDLCEKKRSKGLTMQINFHSLLWSYLPRVLIFLAMTVYIYIYTHTHTHTHTTHTHTLDFSISTAHWTLFTYISIHLQFLQKSSFNCLLVGRLMATNCVILCRIYQDEKYFAAYITSSAHLVIYLCAVILLGCTNQVF